MASNSVEEFAQLVIQTETGQPVVVHDDGSENGMYDLRIGPVDAPAVAIECVGAVDQTFTETWNVGPAKGPFILSVQGDWNVTVKSGAHIKTIKKKLKQLLLELEKQETYNTRVDYWLKRHDRKMFDKFENLGIEHVSCYRKEGTGKISFVMSGVDGAGGVQDDLVSVWIGNFLRDAARRDVIDKLQRSGASECHVFIPVAFKGAPSPVLLYLTGRLDTLPNQNPNLPSPIKQVWIISEFSQKGIR